MLLYNSTNTQNVQHQVLNPNVNFGLWVIMMCHCRFIDCSKGIPRKNITELTEIRNCMDGVVATIIFTIVVSSHMESYTSQPPCNWAAPCNQFWPIGSERSSLLGSKYLTAHIRNVSAYFLLIDQGRHLFEVVRLPSPEGMHPAYLVPPFHILAFQSPCSLGWPWDSF